MEFAIDTEDKAFFKQDDYSFSDAQFILSSDSTNFSYEFLSPDKSKNETSDTNRCEVKVQLSKRDQPSLKQNRHENNNSGSSIESEQYQKPSTTPKNAKVDTDVEKKALLRNSNKRSLEFQAKPTPQKLMKRVDAPRERSDPIDRSECTQEVMRSIESIEEEYDHEVTFDKVQNTINNFLSSISAVEKEFRSRMDEVMLNFRKEAEESLQEFADCCSNILDEFESRSEQNRSAREKFVNIAKALGEVRTIFDFDK